jgi:hypothetical protein
LLIVLPLLPFANSASNLFLSARLFGCRNRPAGGALGSRDCRGPWAFRERVLTTAIPPAWLAQPIEHQTHTLAVTGSTPVPHRELQTRRTPTKRSTKSRRETAAVRSAAPGQHQRRPCSAWMPLKPPCQASRRRPLRCLTMAASAQTHSAAARGIGCGFRLPTVFSYDVRRLRLCDRAKPQAALKEVPNVLQAHQDSRS